MFVHPQFDPVAFQVGPVALRWYGLMYLLAFALFVVLGKYRARQNLLTGWHPRDIDDMLFYGVFGVIVGGRLGYALFYKPLHYLQHPLEVLAVWEAICDRVAALADGRIAAIGRLSSVLKSDHPWVQSYFHGARAQKLGLGN